MIKNISILLVLLTFAAIAVVALSMPTFAKADALDCTVAWYRTMEYRTWSHMNAMGNVHWNIE